MEKRWGILIGLLAAAAVVGCVFFAVIKDDKGPEITFGADVPVYQGNSGDESLLSNVKAEDGKDGDVTDTLYVDSVRVSEDGSRAKVTYVAVDKNNNVTRASQVLSCGSGAAVKEETTTEDTTAAEQGTEDVSTQPEENTKPVENEQTDPKAPVIKLNATEVTLGVSDGFSYNDYVESMTDDKDDASTLSRRLHLDGDYQSKKAGTYEITYSVTDTDGNRSNEATLTLVRK